MYESAARPVVVGIDGSHTAIRAAIWAATEAKALNTPLRLVHVLTSEAGPDPEDGATTPETQYAETALREASSAVRTSDVGVTIDTAIVAGPPGAALTEESRNAALLCVGSSGIGQVASMVLGSTAMEVAARAHCPVAVIRTRDDAETTTDKNWIAVGIDSAPDNPDIVSQAMREAQLRGSAVLAVDNREDCRVGAVPGEPGSRVQDLRDRYRGVDVRPVIDGADVSDFLADHPDMHVQLTVVGNRDADKVADIVGPHGHSLAPHGNCSVLIVR